MRLACWMVESRWAITNEVRSRIRRSSAAWMSPSVWVSTEEFIEDVSGHSPVAVRVPETVERAAGIVGARRREVLMSSLHADRRGELRKAQVERHEGGLDAAFLLLVGEGLPDAEAGGVER